MRNDITKHDMIMPVTLSNYLAAFVSSSYDEQKELFSDIFDYIVNLYLFIQEPFCESTYIRFYEVLCAIAEKLKEHDFYEE